MYCDDLTDASALPAKGDYSEDDAYRATRGFAKTMLAKTYMFKGDFASAETVLHDIIEVDKDYTLLSDYGMNWRTEYENSSESVFEIANKVYDKNIATGTNVPHFFTSRRISGYQGYGFHVQPKISMMPLTQMTRALLTYSHKLVIDIKVILKRRTMLNLQAVIMIQDDCASSRKNWFRRLDD